MSEQEIYTVSPRKARELIVDIMGAGLVPYVHGSPGIGKSAIMKSICAEYNLALIDHRMSTSEPTDLTGLPRFVDGHAEFVPFKGIFPTDDLDLPKGKDGFMLFLDELNSMPRGVQAACFKLILDRMVGQSHLHPNTVITAAGNLSTDRGITNPISTPMQSRMVHLELQVNFQEWLQDVALPQKYDSRIIAYLSQYPSKLMDFRPDHNEKTFCSPRTWEFMNKLIKAVGVHDSKAAMYAGTITSGTALEFLQYCKIFHDLVSVKQVVADPVNTPVPNSPDKCWATITHLMENIDEQNIGALCTYIDRFTLDFKILFFRSALITHNKLLSNNASFRNSVTQISKYLNG